MLADLSFGRWLPLLPAALLLLAGAAEALALDYRERMWAH